MKLKQRMAALAATALRHRVAAVAATALVVAGLVAAVPAAADTTGCPSLSGKQTSNLVGASFTTSATDATYFFDSFVNRNPADTNGDTFPDTPGLISYCVYPGTAPDTVTVDAVGANGISWNDPQQAPQFSFDRPDGNPSNIPLDGTQNIQMGTASWSDPAPQDQTILLHINDAVECAYLYSNGDPDADPNTTIGPGTCWVFPGEAPSAADLTVTKEAHPSFDRTYTWSITKDACKHGTSGTGCVQTVHQAGGTVQFDYAVSVTHDDGTDGNWEVNGDIDVVNTNAFGVDVAVTDVVDNGGTCKVEGDTVHLATVPGAGSIKLSYTCTYTSEPSPADGINTATATWGDIGSAHTSASGSAGFDFGNANANLIDDCVDVRDSNQGFLGTVCVGDANPKTFIYSLTFPVQSGCQSYLNRAEFKTNDTGTRGGANQTVTVCGPARTGALTIGFWQNKNGQGIIKAGASTSGVCNSGTWLRQFNPFQDLSATASCSLVATYVYNVIKAASAGGAAMNPMLKAQMLATALDVYFSDPALGTNKIGAPSPIGAQKIDLTLICKMIDGSGGTATCSGTYQNTSSAFGGGSCQTVSQLLAYENSVSNVGGTTWYAQVKATQELAKNTFDAINNQVAFGC